MGLLVQWAYRRGFETDASIADEAIEEWARWNNAGKKSAEEKLGGEDLVMVICISSPWQTDTDAEINDLWRKFRQYFSNIPGGK